MNTYKLHASYENILEVTEGCYSKRRGYALALMVILQFSLIVNSSWRALPDGALYLALGESLAAGQGYVFNGEPHTYVPPGYPALIALINLLFGQSLLYYRILMSVLGLITGLLGYLLILRLCGKDTAFVLGGVFITSHLLLENSTFTCSDTFFALTVFLAIHLLLYAAPNGQRSSLVLIAVSGVMSGLPALVRVNGWGVPPALAWYLAGASRAYSRARRVVLLTCFLIAGILPSMAWEFYKSSFPQSLNEGTYLNAVLGRDGLTQLAIVAQAFKDYAHEVSYACTGVAIKTGFVEFVAPALIVIGLIRLLMKGERLFVPLAIVQIGGLCLSPAGSRYLIALLPAFFIFLAQGLIYVTEVFSGRLFGSKSPRAVTLRIVPLCMLLLVGLNVVGNIGAIFQARSAAEANGAESYRDQPFFAASRWLKEHAPEATVMTMHPRVIHYLSGLPTIELVRSGVPENLAFVHSLDQIVQLVAIHRPGYFFSDKKNEIMKAHVEKALSNMGLSLQEIPNIDREHRFQLWKILYQ